MFSSIFPHKHYQSLEIAMAKHCVVASISVMMIQRIYAGSIVALLLSVSPLAAACDLSCAFASMKSDCHSEQTDSLDSAPRGMTMNGLTMAGMTMPEMAAGEMQLTVSAISRANASHPSIGEMGPCERQACDSGSAVSVRASRSVFPQLHSILTIAKTSRAAISPPHFHGARDDVPPYSTIDGSPLHLSLRI